MGGEAAAKAEAPASLVRHHWPPGANRKAGAGSVAPADANRWPADRHGRRAGPWLRHSRDRRSGESRQSDLAPFGSRRDCVWAVTVRPSHLSRAIERQVREGYELQLGDRSNDLNILPKASCRHRNTLLVGGGDRRTRSRRWVAVGAALDRGVA